MATNGVQASNRVTVYHDAAGNRVVVARCETCEGRGCETCSGLGFVRVEDERALIKPEAIRRIMESRGMAATPAEKIVESDDLYAAHREKQRDAEVMKWAAVSKYESSKLTAKLDVALATRGMDV